MSLLAAVLVLDLLGYTFNALVTLGLLLALAMVAGEAAGTAHRLMSRLRAEAGDGEPAIRGQRGGRGLRRAARPAGHRDAGRAGRSRAGRTGIRA